MIIDFSQIRLTRDLEMSRVDVARKGALDVLAQQVEQAAQIWWQGVPMVERLGWVAKEAAARAYVAGHADAEQKAMILTEAEAGGDTSDDLALKILQKAGQYSTFVARLTGERRRIARLLETAETVDEIDAIMALAPDVMGGTAAQGGEEGSAKPS